MHRYQDQAKPTLLKRMKTAALSGGTTGAALGAMHAITSPAATAEKIGLAALKGGAAMGAATPAAIYAGEKIMGTPGKEEVNPYTHRGLVGGAALGAGLGGLGAAYLASGKKLPFAKLGSFGDTDNIILSRIRKWAENPSARNIAKAVALGGGALGLAGAHFAGEEGSGVDILQNELDAHAKRRLQRRAQQQDDSDV